MRAVCRSIACCLLLAASPFPALAEEGMWMPGQTQEIAAALKQAGLQLDPARLGDLDQPPLTAIASLGGCSAAFLSPQGLVATNHHCVYGSVQYNSKPGQDYLTDGFLAASLGDELPAAPGSRIYVIEDLREVTAAMNRGLSAKMDGLGRTKRLEANRKALIAACERQPSRRCDVRSYFGGAQYWLQQQLEIKDVRLVYAPAGGIGNFGGETDNWMWPRHTGDFGFYRAYVAPDGSSAPYARENVPFRPKAWLKVARGGVQEGDFVMVAGFPGSTDRLRTAAEARFAFETYYPAYQASLADYAARIEKATAGDQDATIRYASILRGQQNYMKKTLGQMQGADRISLSARKAAQEQAYRDWIAADRSRAGFAEAAAALDRVIAEGQQADMEDLVLGKIGRAQLLAAARTAYRWAKEREKPDAEREPGYQDRDRRPVEERLAQIERRFAPKVDRALFEAALEDYRRSPAADAAFLAALDRVGLDRLYAETRLGDTALRKAWLDKPAAAFETSDDPFIQLAVALYPRGMERELDAKARAGREQAARSQYMRGMLAWAQGQGRSLYPDANGSLRFTYGKVTGKQVDGQTWAPFTTAEGLAAKQTGKGEFAAPQRMIDLIKARDYGKYTHPALGTLPVDFMSTVDITNGNSGSSTLNARGEFVGLAFDGTLDGVISDWSYDAASNRTIHVDSRFMLWTMEKVDHADRLIAEMDIGE